jgi:putative oxidoreductase
MTFLQVPKAFQRLGPDIGLLWLRVSTALLLFLTNGWPKIMGFTQELQHIDDPWGIGRAPTLWLALFAEVACPVAIALGWMTRLACVPIIVLLLVAMVLVHPDWNLGQGQFGWLYLIVFSTIMLTGPGRWSVDIHPVYMRQRNE